MPALATSIFLAVPLVVVQAAGLAASGAQDMISLTMTALAGATVLQMKRRGPLGSSPPAIPAAQNV